MIFTAGRWGFEKQVSMTIVIIGTGHAGVTAALELRQADYSGRLVVVGEEAQLPYDRPQLSKAVLLGEVKTCPLLHGPETFSRLGIEILNGVRAQQIDRASRTVWLSTGDRLAYDKLLLATGGRARSLNIPGGHHAVTLRSYIDATRLSGRLRRPGHLTVVGAGVIGLEVAASARTRGWSVTVLEYGDRPLARVVPPELGLFCASLHESAGVELRFDTHVECIETSSKGRFRVRTPDDTLTTNLIVAGVGMQPNMELADSAGIRVEDAIVVDERGQTNDPFIFAAGDACRFFYPRASTHIRMETWQHAARHAAIVARNMMGGTLAYNDIPWLWSDQYDVNIQVLGFPLQASHTVLRGTIDSRKFVMLHLTDDRLIGATLVNMGREMRPCKLLIESDRELDVEKLRDISQPLRLYAAQVNEESVI